jgi:lysophospholipase
VVRGDGTLRVSGGLRLNYRTYEVPDARGALVIVHGLADHGGRFERVADAVAAMDVSAFVLDMRGHGRSEGRRGHAAAFGTLLQDLDRFRREVMGLIDPSTPVFILGHSLGGLIALRYQEEYPGMFAGAIVVSPWLATAMPVPRWKAMLANGLARSLPALPMRAHIPAAYLSHDSNIVRAYREDPFVHDRITPRLFVEASRAMGTAFQRADRIVSPLLILLAGADRIVDTERSLAFARSLRAADVTIRVYPDAYHEVLNEPGDEVKHDLRAWLDERLRGASA